jgi:hypothetical protein
MKSFPLKSGTRKGSPVSPHLFNIVMDSYPRAISQEDNTKRSQTRKLSQIVLIHRLLWLYNLKTLKIPLKYSEI